MSTLRFYSWANGRYSIDAEGNIKERINHEPPQHGGVPRFIADEMLRLASIDHGYHKSEITIEDPALDNPSCDLPDFEKSF